MASTSDFFNDETHEKRKLVKQQPSNAISPSVVSSYRLRHRVVFLPYRLCVRVTRISDRSGKSFDITTCLWSLLQALFNVVNDLRPINDCTTSVLTLCCKLLIQSSGQPKSNFLVLSNNYARSLVTDIHFVVHLMASKLIKSKIK